MLTFKTLKWSVQAPKSQPDNPCIGLITLEPARSAQRHRRAHARRARSDARPDPPRRPAARRHHHRRGPRLLGRRRSALGGRTARRARRRARFRRVRPLQGACQLFLQRPAPRRHPARDPQARRASLRHHRRDQRSRGRHRPRARHRLRHPLRLRQGQARRGRGPRGLRSGVRRRAQPAEVRRPRPRHGDDPHRRDHRRQGGASASASSCACSRTTR